MRSFFLKLVRIVRPSLHERESLIILTRFNSFPRRSAVKLLLQTVGMIILKQAL